MAAAHAGAASCLRKDTDGEARHDRCLLFIGFIVLLDFIVILAALRNAARVDRMIERERVVREWTIPLDDEERAS